jgi:hypothetical protein
MTPPDPTHRCANCVWSANAHCQRHELPIVDPLHTCDSWQANVDCLTCGACCREAFTAVEVDDDDPFVTSHPDRIERSPFDRWVIRRSGARCGCLSGELGNYACVIYEHRPRTCRDFTQGSSNCAQARVRVGLTT